MRTEKQISTKNINNFVIFMFFVDLLSFLQ